MSQAWPLRSREEPVFTVASPHKDKHARGTESCWHFCCVIGRLPVQITANLFAIFVRFSPINSTPSLYFTSFLFKAPCQLTPLLNLRSLVIVLTLFGWYICIYLSLCFLWGYHCWVTAFLLMPTFSGTQGGRKTGSGCTLKCALTAWQFTLHNHVVNCHRPYIAFAFGTNSMELLSFSTTKWPFRQSINYAPFWTRCMT